VIRMQAALPLPPSPGRSTASPQQGEGFGKTLLQSLNKVNELQMEAEAAARDVAAGKTDELHRAVIAAEKAHLSLQLTIAIRNRALEAYQEVMRMQV
jgi:flagellar hook-basal body complex protein FliE